MHVQNFPLCCKAKILCGFPEGDQQDSQCMINRNGTRLEQSRIHPKVIKKWVQDTMHEQYMGGIAFLVTSLTQDQKKAQKVLDELGWRHTTWGNKLNQLSEGYNRGTKIRVYTYQLDQMDPPAEVKALRKRIADAQAAEERAHVRVGTV